MLRGLARMSYMMGLSNQGIFMNRLDPLNEILDMDRMHHEMCPFRVDFLANTIETE